MHDIKKGRQYTFDGFEVTKANSKAYEAAKRFAEDASSKPLALFGGTATGKTHLLYAVKNTIEQNTPEQTVILTTTAEMMSLLVDALLNCDSAKQFREKYTQADVLLVDDIQELAGKEAIQNELILIFNSFYESGKRFMMTSSQKEAGYGIQDRLVIREFCGDFAVITRAYIHAKFEQNQERDEKRASLLKESEQVYWGISHDKEFSIESFKSYFKNVWSYFSQNIRLFDIDREDAKIICYLNRVDTVLHCKLLSNIEVWEQNACILFLKGLIYTLTSYDIIMYEEGFYGDGVLFIPLPHHAGTSDCLEIKIDEFDNWFNRYCEGYKSTRSGKRLSKIHWRLDR
ncbi:DnaA/Hda family protein [Ruminococcus sp.]|jgi:DNA replication protein DnaC|uniref:DnaA/Hda family protein n=1 Tax=Ruminococcus sp. TaxID=41978 RepID=UPI0025CD4768|nr:DnaA/Hda family protein [Ruminococcus sp.]